MANHFAVNRLFWNFTVMIYFFVCFMFPAIVSHYLKNSTCQLWASCFITLYWLNDIERLSFFLLFYCSFTEVLVNPLPLTALPQLCPSLETWCGSQITLSRTTGPFFPLPSVFSLYHTNPFIYSTILWACCFFLHQTFLRWLVTSGIWITVVPLQGFPQML